MRDFHSLLVRAEEEHMADVHSCGNNDGGDGKSLFPPSNRANECLAPATSAESPAPDDDSVATEADDAFPPPPRLLPDAVAQMAAGLLVAPERAGPAGMPVVGGY